MINKEKISRLIGLAMRSRKLSYGEYSTLEAIKNGKAKIVFIASDISQNTEKRLLDKSNYRNITTSRIFDRYELGNIIGKEFSISIAIIDTNFANGIKEYLGGQTIGKEKSVHNS